VLVASSQVPAQNVAQLIALAKSQPGKVSYGSIGSGSQMHLITETLNNKAGIHLLHVPYKGMPQLSTAVMTGEIGVTWLGLFSARPHIKSGKLKVLAYSDSKRSSFMPDLPTLAELGYPDVVKSVWYGLFAPARTPRPLLERILATSEAAADEFPRKKCTPRGRAERRGAGRVRRPIRRQYEAGAMVLKISGARVE
jgi:tripartite-type tricarboxylate transporter receptor subunit TctC